MHVGRSIYGGVDAAVDAFVGEVMRHVDPAAGEDMYRYKNDFSGWCRDVARVDPEQYQDDIGTSVVENRITLVPSCNGSGKSFIAALIIIWWVTTRPDPYVVWTAPRWTQVKKTMGRYLGAVIRMLEKHDVHLGLHITLSQELYRDGVPIGHGASPADGDEQGISGIHAEHVLVVVDEADQVGAAIWAALDSYLTTEGSRALGIGNPHNTSSTFKAKQDAPLPSKKVIRIDGLQLPTMSRSQVERFPELYALFIDEGLPFADEDVARRALKKGIASASQYASWLIEWGVDHPYWYAKVRGLYPPASEYQMFTQSMLDAAYALQLEPIGGRRSFGFDIAEQGGDETTGYRVEPADGGIRARNVYAKRGGATPLADAVAAIKRTIMKHHRVAVDANGVGWGVYEQLMKLGYHAVAHKGGRKARRPDVYTNRKAELFYGLQERLLEGTLDLDPEDELLAAQLLSIRWVPADRRTVETRADRARRKDPSPDRADALSIAVGYAVSSSSKPRDASSIAAGESSGGGWDDNLMDREF